MLELPELRTELQIHEGEFVFSTHGRQQKLTVCLQVHSQELLTKPIAWPQPPMSDAVISPTSSMEVYGHPEPGALSNVQVAPCSRLAGYDMASIDPHAVFSRQSYGVNQVNYGAGTSVYNGQVATQTLPSASQNVLNDYYGWNSSYHINKDPNEAVFPDNPQPNNALTQSAYSYMLPGQGTRCDAPSLAPGPLPFDGQGTERVLPHPTSRPQLQTKFPALPSAALPFAGNTWETTHRGSMQNMTSEPFTTTSPGHQIKQDPSSPQDMVLGYIPMASSTTSSPYPGLETVESADDFRTSSDSRFTGAYPREGNGRLLSVSTTGSDYSPDSTSNNNNNYTYSSSSERCRTLSETSDSATLVNGLPYTPVKHSGAHSDDGLSFSMLTSDPLSDYRTSGEIQRNPRY